MLNSLMTASVPSAGDQPALRQRNLAALLELLRRHGLLTRTELAQLSGLNRATITRLVRELIVAGLVCEDGVQASAGGRPAIPLRLNSQAGIIIGAEIGYAAISAIVTDFTPTILTRIEKPLHPGASHEEELEQALQVICAAYEEAGRFGRPIMGLGLGVPGLVDSATGTLLFAPNLGWTDVPLKKILEDRLNIPVLVDNVASVSALGESTFGAAQNRNVVLYLSTQGGLGGRIVTHGQILRGASGFAGEVGHMTVADGGRRCNCGRTGCWETFASQMALLRDVSERLEAGEPSILRDMAPDSLQITVAMVAEAANCGDELARSALSNVGHWLGVGLANLINMLNPDLVVIGGSLSAGHRVLLPVIESVLATEVLRWVRKDCEITFAAHGADTCLFGCVATVYREVLSQPHRWL
jgi:glucokinase-like ROK family protein